MNPLRPKKTAATVLAAVLLATPLTAMIVLSATNVHAQGAAKATVDAAKAAGTVGEQADGTLGIVAGGDASTRAAVAEINAGRAAAYREAAARTGVTPTAAGEAAYRQLLSRMAPGQYYKPAGGGWTRK